LYALSADQRCIYRLAGDAGPVLCFSLRFTERTKRTGVRLTQIDLGTGNNNKINWAMSDKQEFIDVCEVVFRGARKGRGLVVSPKDYSTKYRY